MGSAPLIAEYPIFVNYGELRLFRPTQIPKFEINKFTHLKKLMANRGFTPRGGLQGERTPISRRAGGMCAYLSGLPNSASAPN